ncbi:urea carboxylase [Acinetobacter defluvii]|uniref:urea amidolyase associated protein UAAP1 n=1 Tax=Acinetobacter defluvii TaxID=1871111 RepID=UPI00148F6D7F|nr:urea amidolyase associated protein UAAP1 [Acinetobacter defluvii]NNP73325.1 urea carboxylase [Acinetobacter defluvii]
MTKSYKYHNDQALWTEILPGGHHWSGRIQRGTVLQIKALAAHANVSFFCVNAEDKLERYNMSDSLKAQHTAFLSTGHILASDLGRAMISIVQDDHGWNDAICAPSSAAQIKKQFGVKTFQDARNDMYRNAKDSLILEMTKFGLGATDLSATVNFFSRVIPDDTGHLSYIESNNTNQIIELRFEMDCLVFLSAAPHGLDTLNTYAPADIELKLFKALPLAETDICRDACPQNQRAFQNNARYYALDAV